MASLKIQQLDPIEHILKRPDMYVGSIRSKKSEEYIFKSTTPSDISIEKKSISYPPALLRIFVEALSNAIDNVQRSREAQISCSKIKVCIDRETGETSIWNDGFVIPIEKQPGTDKFKHTLIFGELRTSTNFDDDEQRTVSGRNGLGIKLLNVFSSKFVVKSVDPSQNKQFVQEWSNNMRNVKPPKITTSDLKTGFTEVSWIPDFSIFGMAGYTDDIYNLYLKYIVDGAMLTRVNVYINNEKLPVKTLQDYAKLFNSPTSELVYTKSADSEVVVSTSDEFEAVSFVNGVSTINGGKHVDSWSEAIFRPIVEHYNKPKAPQINIKDVKQFYRLFVVSTLVNPEFTSQSKTELASPEVKAVVDKKVTGAILKWEHTKKITDIIQSKEMLIMKKIETNQRKTFKAIYGYEPANEAGGKYSKDCTLALCEGLSAKTFVVKGMDTGLFGKSGRDWIGVYALSGKILNVIKASPSTIVENKVIKDVIRTIGLRHAVDYRKDENFNQLNYGRLMILTDADSDGKHIAGLIMTFIHHLFPSLLDRKHAFLVDMMTPIAKFTIGTDERVFYDLFSADEYYKSHSNSKINVKYYKGLGTHRDYEIKKVFGERVISYIKDANAHQSIHKAFGKDTLERKLWMEKYDPRAHTPIDETTLQEPISHFIDETFIEFPIDDCKRSIPSIMDGLKQSQRKILYACFLRKLKSTTLKVAQLAGYVAEKTNYHHGEQNLFETITKMAHDFVGSNNIPLLYRDGQFGSRSENGKDAANARYIFTRLEEIVEYIFRPEDDELLERVIDDGDIVEPVFYVPIFPMILVNGTDGIGTGWSSSIPLYNPNDIVKMVKDWIDVNDFESDQYDCRLCISDNITPWYKGFKGNIHTTSKETKYETEGILVETDNSVEIAEIPIGMSIKNLQEILDKLREDKKIKNYKNYSTANHVRYIIEQTSDFKCSIDSLKLKTTLSLDNMVLFDSTGKIKKYNSIEDIVDEFCFVRLRLYKRRRDAMIENLNHQIIITKNKLRFISEIINDKIVLKRKKTSEVNDMLRSCDYFEDNGNFSYLLRLQIGTFTDEKIVELEDELVDLETKLKLVTDMTEKQMWLAELEEFESKYDPRVLQDDESATKKSKKGGRRRK